MNSQITFELFSNKQYISNTNNLQIYNFSTVNPPNVCGNVVKNNQSVHLPPWQWPLHCVHPLMWSHDTCTCLCPRAQSSWWSEWRFPAIPEVGKWRLGHWAACALPCPRSVQTWTPPRPVWTTRCCRCLPVGSCRGACIPLIRSTSQQCLKHEVNSQHQAAPVRWEPMIGHHWCVKCLIVTTWLANQSMWCPVNPVSCSYSIGNTCPVFSHLPEAT